MATRAFIGLGSNLAHPRRQLARALARLAALDGVRVLAVSPNYATAPIGGMPQPDYVNAVALVETILSPRALLSQLVRHPGRFYVNVHTATYPTGAVSGPIRFGRP